DYFSETGQLWGNPLYRWDKMEEDDFLWWRKRMAKMYELVDIIRIDHFRGFEAYWEIQGGAETAIVGQWLKAPGHKLFTILKEKLGDLPILAEDLGVITKEVEELRDAFEFPGMKILQFAFGDDMEEKFLPHNHIENCVVYTGSHDNDTTRSFFETEKQNGSGIYEWAQYYMNYYGDDMVFAAIKTAYSSVANIVVIPLQDMLNLGNEARMNFPGTLGGNWTWRFSDEHITSELVDTYKKMSGIYGRSPDGENSNNEEVK
ncbi:MAG: 4-alpha-glucanotransferase, partial [Candidatus Heimdallarchaeota archaeon]|nr:4-alpha-glucanotransferase [Candidatus Heimdallarchaeota archaeon]